MNEWIHSISWMLAYLRTLLQDVMLIRSSADMHGTILSSETTIFAFLRLFETFRSHFRTQHQFEHYLEISNFTGHLRTIFDLTSHFDSHAPSHGPHSTLILHPSRDHTLNSIDFELVPGLAISL